jgi:hypothetical protein
MTGILPLALQATLAVEPADKRLSLVRRLGRVMSLALIERFDSPEASNLLARKPYLLKLPDIGQRWERLWAFHGHPPVSLSWQIVDCTPGNACIKLTTCLTNSEGAVSW